jgi:hypothetical protein
MMSTLAESLDLGKLVPIVAIVGGLSIAMISIVTGCVTAIARARLREQSRREIAAYIAEGTMTPEQGERILNAGRKHDAREKNGCSMWGCG